MRKPNTEKVIEFLQRDKTMYGVPKTRTDPATIFRSNKFKGFCKKWHIIHVEYPIRDHRGIGKVERLIRTINERQRANKKIIITNYKTGLSEILFALRMNPSATKKSPYERYTGQEPNTIKRIKPNTNQFFSEKPEFELTVDDFESGQDSTIMIRERARGSKLEGAFKKRKGTLLEHSNHTITFQPAGRTASTIFSKRDLGHNPDDQPCCSKWPIRNTPARKQTSEEENETPTELNQQIENEMPTEREMTNERKTTNQSEPRLPGPIKNQTAQQKLKLKTTTKEQTETRKSMAKTTGHHHMRVRRRRRTTKRSRTNNRGRRRGEKGKRRTKERSTKTPSVENDRGINPTSSGITSW